MKKGWLLVGTLFLLSGCINSGENKLSSVNRVEVRFGEEVKSTIEEPEDVEQLVVILLKAKRGNLVREESYVLSEPLVYEFYEGDQLVQTVLFNGEDTTRILKGGLCYEVEYEGISVSEWYEKLILP